MQRTPPPKLPSRPSLTVSVYTTLPDASKADLPPKPPTTPTTPTFSQLRNPRGVLTPSPSPEPRSKKAHRGQKRTYPYSSDAIVVPLQTTQTLKRPRDVPINSHKYDDAGEYKSIERPAKRVCPPSFPTTGVYGTMITQDEPMDGKINHQAFEYTSKPDEAQLELRLIHNKLLGGATALTAQVHYYLRRRMTTNVMKLSPLLVHLIIEQVVNKTHELSYAIMDWAHKRHEKQLLEDVLTDRLYKFDVEAAFNEGLMSIREVSNLMDCQIVLECVRMEQVRGAKAVPADVGTYSDANESDTGSEEMDMSDNSD